MIDARTFTVTVPSALQWDSPSGSRTTVGQPPLGQGGTVKGGSSVAPQEGSSNLYSLVVHARVKGR